MFLQENLYDLEPYDLAYEQVKETLILHILNPLSSVTPTEIVQYYMQ
jgi:hypothetical protein